MSHVINNPINEIYEENIAKAAQLREEIFQAWEKCNENDDFCDKAKEIEEEKTIEFEKLLFEFYIVELLKSVYPLEENQVYNVDEIFISSNIEDKVKEYNKELLKLFYKDKYKDNYIDKILSYHFLNYSFRTKDDIEDNQIILSENFIQSKK